MSKKNPRRTIKLKLGQVRTHANTIENIMFFLLDMYGEERWTIDELVASVFDEKNIEEYAGRKKYIQFCVMIYYYTQQLKDVLNEYDMHA